MDEDGKVFDNATEVVEALDPEDVGDVLGLILPQGDSSGE